MKKKTKIIVGIISALLVLASVTGGIFLGLSADSLFGKEEVVNLAKIFGDFKENYKLLDKCKSFKFEHAPETTLARAYEKFEKVLLKELDFSYKELKLMRQSERYTEEMLDKKLNELCSNPDKYSKTINKLGKAISEMEASLHGNNNAESVVRDLIAAIEMNYNKTSKQIKIKIYVMMCYRLTRRALYLNEFFDLISFCSTRPFQPNFYPSNFFK